MTLDFQDTCLVYPTTADAYGRDVLGEPVEVPCMYVQETGYQHSNSQDAITGAPRIAFPPDDPFILSKGFRLEGMIAEVNVFGAAAGTQRFKIVSVTPARDVLLDNEVQHVECELQKVAAAA